MVLNQNYKYCYRHTNNSLSVDTLCLIHGCPAGDHRR